MLKLLFFLLWSQFTIAQETDFFTNIVCEPDQPKKGVAFDISFYKKDAMVKIHEYDEKGQKTDLFPTRILKAHVFLSRQFCKFHVISRRPSVDMFHFVMTVQDLTDKEISSFEGPAHFNFLIDKTGIETKKKRRVGCKINGLELPGYYFHSCQKSLKPIPTPRPNVPVRTTPAFEYNYGNPGTGSGGSSR